MLTNNFNHEEVDDRYYYLNNRLECNNKDNFNFYSIDWDSKVKSSRKKSTLDKIENNRNLINKYEEDSFDEEFDFFNNLDYENSEDSTAIACHICKNGFIIRKKTKVFCINKCISFDTSNLNPDIEFSFNKFYYDLYDEVKKHNNQNNSKLKDKDNETKCIMPQWEIGYNCNIVCINCIFNLT